MKSKVIVLVIAVFLIIAAWSFTDSFVFYESSFHYEENPVLEAENPVEGVDEDLNNENVVIQRDPSAEFRFFYNQLNEEDREIYQTLRDGLMVAEPSIRLDTDDIELVIDIFERVFWDYPEIFWATGAANTQLITRVVGQNHINFMPEYSHLGDAKVAMQLAIDERVDAFLATIDEEMSDFEVVLAVYEYIILTTSYNLNAPDHQNIVSVFINGESVCAGISKAAQLLLNRLGIFATYVVGDAFVDGHNGPMPHAWNLVRVDGEYYHLDVTWGLPSFNEDNEMATQISILYDYFLLNDDLIATTHQIRDGVVTPAATSLRNNFFVVNGMFYEAVDEAQLLTVLQASIEANQISTTFKFANAELFEIARPLLLEELVFEAATPRARELGLERIHFRFIPKENLNMITIYWVWE